MALEEVASKQVDPATVPVGQTLYQEAPPAPSGSKTQAYFCVPTMNHGSPPCSSSSVSVLPSTRGSPVPSATMIGSSEEFSSVGSTGSSVGCGVASTTGTSVRRGSFVTSACGSKGVNSGSGVPSTPSSVGSISTSADSVAADTYSFELPSSANTLLVNENTNSIESTSASPMVLNDLNMFPSPINEY